MPLEAAPQRGWSPKHTGAGGRTRREDRGQDRRAGPGQGGRIRDRIRGRRRGIGWGAGLRAGPGAARAMLCSSEAQGVVRTPPLIWGLGVRDRRTHRRWHVASTSMAGPRRPRGQSWGTSLCRRSPLRQSGWKGKRRTRTGAGRGEEQRDGRRAETRGTHPHPPQLMTVCPGRLGGAGKTEDRTFAPGRMDAE